MKNKVRIPVEITDISNLESLSSWGGFFEILALCYVLSANFFLYMVDKPPLIISLEELCHSERISIHIAYLEDVHFASVRPIGDEGNTPVQKIDINFPTLNFNESLFQGGSRLLHPADNPSSSFDNSHAPHLTKSGLPDRRFKANRSNDNFVPSLTQKPAMAVSTHPVRRKETHSPCPEPALLTNLVHDKSLLLHPELGSLKIMRTSLNPTY